MSLDLVGIPDIQVPAAELLPFSPEDGLGCDIAFSDDGRLLAAISSEGTLVVYETAGWPEVCRITEAVSLHSPRLMWVPGGTVVTIAAADDDTIEQVAFDPRTGDSVAPRTRPVCTRRPWTVVSTSSTRRRPIASRRPCG